MLKVKKCMSYGQMRRSKLLDATSKQSKFFKSSVNIEHIQQVPNTISNSISMFQNQIKQNSKPSKFNMTQIQTFNTFSALQINGLSEVHIQKDKVKEIICNDLKLVNLYDPINQAMLLYQDLKQYSEFFRFRNLMKVLIKGQFYRFIPRNIQSRLLVNGRTTEINIKIIIASLVLLCSKRLTIKEISNSVLIFTLQQTLCSDSRDGIQAQSSKVIKLLQKIERKMKEQQFAIWFQSLRQKQCEKKKIPLSEWKFFELNQFLFLVGISQKKSQTKLFFQVKGKKLLSYFKEENKQQSNNRNGFITQKSTFEKENKQNEQSYQNQNNQTEMIGVEFFQRNNKRSIHNQIVYRQIKRSLSCNVRQPRPFSSILSNQIQSMKKKKSYKNKLAKKVIPLGMKFWQNMDIKLKQRNPRFKLVQKSQKNQDNQQKSKSLVKIRNIKRARSVGTPNTVSTNFTQFTKAYNLQLSKIKIGNKPRKNTFNYLC